MDLQAPVEGPGVAVARGDAPWPPAEGPDGPSPFDTLRPSGPGGVLDDAFVLLRTRFGRIVGLAACLYVPIRLLDLVTMIATGTAVERVQVGPSDYYSAAAGTAALDRLLSGGFLEAAPLTAFCVICLAAANHRDHQVAREGERFLLTTVRPDGSWPIDTSLAQWCTSLAAKAVAPVLSDAERNTLAELIRQRLRGKYASL